MPDRKFFFELLDTHSPSGWEASGQARWVKELKTLAETVETDAYGSAWATLPGPADDSPKLLFEAHVDEIGFLVKHIDKDGFLYLAPIGGSDRTIAGARRIRIFGDRGEVSGIIGHTAIHLQEKGKEKVPEWKDLFADVGASSPEAVAELGLRVGHPAIYADGAKELASGRATGRAIDNRIGGYILASIMERMRPTKPPCTVLAANTIQEEIGGAGARMVAHRLQPDAAIVFDVTHATDTPGINHCQHGKVELGKGPTVAHGAANHPGLVSRLIDLAAKKNIPLQHEAISQSTRTNADVVFISRTGIPTALVSIPMRYMHSPAEIIDFSDVDYVIELACEFAAGFDSKTL